MTDVGAGPPEGGFVPPGNAVDAPAGTSLGSPVPGSSDMVHTVTTIDRAIKERRDVDTELVNWWLYILLLSWITFGIYSIVLLFKRINRIDGFSRRKSAYYAGVIEWTQRYARQQGKEDAVHHQLDDLRGEVTRAYQNDLKPIKAGLSVVLTLVTLGLYGLYVLYRQNKYWWDAQVLEQDFDDKLSQVWTTLGIVRYPINFTIDQSKRRSYALYLILSFATIGIWGLVWDYKIHTDPDNIYRELHGIEDTVLQTIRAA